MFLKFFNQLPEKPLREILVEVSRYEAVVVNDAKQSTFEVSWSESGVPCSLTLTLEGLDSCTILANNGSTRLGTYTAKPIEPDEKPKPKIHKKVIDGELVDVIDE